LDLPLTRARPQSAPLGAFAVATAFSLRPLTPPLHAARAVKTPKRLECLGLTPAQTDTVFPMSLRNPARRNPNMESGRVAKRRSVSKMDVGGAFARPQIRSSQTSPKRARARIPAAGVAPGQTSERTTSHEDYCISARPAGQPKPVKRNMENTNWNERKYFGALDWASDHHDVVVVDKTGATVYKSRIQHTPEGWQKLREELVSFLPLAIAVETNHGMAVEQMIALGYEVYPVNPKSSTRYRDRKAPSGVKDDELDAWSLADALRVDGHGWRRLMPDDPLVVELRLLTRDEVSLISQRTSFVNELQAALRDYYPAALAAFDDWTRPNLWEFIETFPTPEILQTAGKKKWEKFLRTHKLWREDTAEKRMVIFETATALQGSPGAVAAKSLLAVSVVKVLIMLQAQLDAYRARIEERFHQHPDHDLFGSLPGTGTKLAPRLLGEIGDNRSRFDCAEGLQSYAGTAPVTFQSGQIERHRVRRACAMQLRSTIHLWVNLSRQKCAWAEAYYQAHREKGQSHACALRCLGQRWLKILWKMWQTKTCYDETVHMRNQLKHGSWLLALQPPKA